MAVKSRVYKYRIDTEQQLSEISEYASAGKMFLKKLISDGMPSEIGDVSVRKWYLAFHTRFRNCVLMADGVDTEKKRTRVTLAVIHYNIAHQYAIQNLKELGGKNAEKDSD